MSNNKNNKPKRVSPVVRWRIQATANDVIHAVDWSPAEEAWHDEGYDRKWLELLRERTAKLLVEIKREIDRLEEVTSLDDAAAAFQQEPQT